MYTKCLSERRLPTAWKNAKMMIIFKKGNKKDLKNYIPICLLSNIYKILTNVLMKNVREDTQGKPATRASWIQKRILNDRPHARRKPAEGEVQIRRLQESLRLSANSSSTDLASRTGDRRYVHRTPEGTLHQQLDDSPPIQRKQ